ncbi:hypothetical protein QE390_004295 [Siphonobacter sp. SORGH_AS 1065]|nr:hypothetical protein [Siphonobacter sp. SORGH_AS_1065]
MSFRTSILSWVILENLIGDVEYGILLDKIPAYKGDFCLNPAIDLRIYTSNHRDRVFSIGVFSTLPIKQFLRLTLYVIKSY